MTEFIECPSLSVSFDATGKASVSLSIIKDSPGVNIGDYTDLVIGGKNFDLVVMSAAQQPLIGSEGWFQWSLQMEGVAD